MKGSWRRPVVLGGEALALLAWKDDRDVASKPQSHKLAKNAEAYNAFSVVSISNSRIQLRNNHTLPVNIPSKTHPMQQRSAGLF